jgi:hypothetical protein
LKDVIEAFTPIEMVNPKLKELESAALTYSNFLVPALLLILTLAMFGRVLLSPGDQILSHSGTDLSSQFVYWRQFGFRELRAGHLALWNPYVFSGAPFFGAFQPALLYPPNWIYLILPLPKAINCEIALHVFLLGLLMSLWVGHHGLHPAAVLFGSVTMMFGGAFFLHIFPGHLSALDAMAWAPLILLTTDKLVEDPIPKWVLIGIFASAMELLAGHPQTLFNLLVTCVLYGALRLPDAPRLRQTILSIGIVGIGAMAITAVQLWTGLQAASEGTRHGGLSYDFAALLPFPPRNFLTLVVPGFFGNLGDVPSSAPPYLWEMCPFLGLTGLSMAILSLFGKSPRRLIWMVMVLLLFWIALGDNTPLFAVLFRFVPGFNSFRCSSKFIFDAALFLTMMAALGVDGLLHSPHGTKVGTAALLLGGLILAVGGVLLTYNNPSENLVGARIFSGDIDSMGIFLHHAGVQCLRSSGALLALGAILLLRRFVPRAAYLAVVVGVAEMFVFAHSTLTTFSVAQTIPTATHQFLAAHPGDYRILNLVELQSNSAMADGAQDISGYDPVMLKRYAQFIGYSQGYSPENAGMYDMTFSHFGGLLQLARLRFIFFPVANAAGNQLRIVEKAGALPHLQFVSEWIHDVDRDDILSTLKSRAFDPRKTAILESSPDALPQSGLATGTARILDGNSDSMLISAQISKPGLLLVTDCYSRYWRALALPHSSQTSYQVLPADYTFMAVPLEAGSHLFRLEYRPSGYTIGRWISIGALAAYLLALGLFFRRNEACRVL